MGELPLVTALQDGAAGPRWEPLRRQVAALAPGLSAPPPDLRGPDLRGPDLRGPDLRGPDLRGPDLRGPDLRGPDLRSAAASGLCPVCRGPAGPRASRCYPCTLHAECLPGLLPEVVVPVAYAPKGGQHATRLWRYKAGGSEAAAAARELRALLITFLLDHGQCVWRRAGMTRPTHVAVVPSGRGREGPHPLWSLAGGSLALPRAGLTLRLSDDHRARDADPGRFAAPPLPGARILLLDDTWTTGASVVSAAAALKLAGARAVVVVVLGRHLGRLGAPGPATFGPARLPFRPELCGVHRDPALCVGLGR
jgi:hypothetical protein